METCTKKNWSTKGNPFSKTWKKIKSLGRTSKKSKDPDSFAVQDDTNAKNPDIFVTQSEKDKNPDTLVVQESRDTNPETFFVEEEKSMSAYPPSSPRDSSSVHFTKSLSCPCSPQRSPQQSPARQKNKKSSMAPQGCFTVYVGPEKQRFVVRAKMVNHPLFQVLLDDAEEEFGYQRQGPLLLPCQVSFFFRVLAEIESLDDDDLPSSPVCGLFSPRRSSSYHLLSAPSSFRLNNF